MRVLEETCGLLNPCAEPTLALTSQALQKNQAQMDELVAAISSGKAHGALWELLNAKAAQLKLEQETMLVEQRRLQAGEFPPGSMGPKVESAHRFATGGGRAAIITDPASLLAAIRGEEAPTGQVKPSSPRSVFGRLRDAFNPH